MNKSQKKVLSVPNVPVIERLPEVKSMTTEQIKRALRTKSDRHSVLGYSLAFWQMNLTRELTYRKERDNAVINSFTNRNGLPNLLEMFNESIYKIKWKRV